MDISIEAIEADLLIAEAQGVPLRELALVRARIRATLLAAQPPIRWTTNLSETDLLAATRQQAQVIMSAPAPVGPVYDIDDSSPWHEKIEVAAKVLGLHQSVLADALINPAERYLPPLEDQPADPGEDPDDDEDEDFFAEARKGKK